MPFLAILKKKVADSNGRFKNDGFHVFYLVVPIEGKELDYAEISDVVRTVGLSH